MNWSHLRNVSHKNLPLFSTTKLLRHFFSNIIDHRQTGYTDIIFFSCDLDLDGMILISR